MPKHHVLKTRENDNVTVFTRHLDIRRQLMVKAPLIAFISNTGNPELISTLYEEKGPTIAIIKPLFFQTVALAKAILY